MWLKPVYFSPFFLPLTKPMRRNLLESWSNMDGQKYLYDVYESYNDTLLWRDDKKDYYMLLGNDTPNGFMLSRILEKPVTMRWDSDKVNFYLQQYRRDPEMDI
jgi:hypothetical protein